MQAALDAGLLVAVEEEDARPIPHLPVPRHEVVLVPREAVDQEVIAACKGKSQQVYHGGTQQMERYLLLQSDKYSH